MSTKGVESAQNGLRWRGPARRKEQGNGRDSTQVSQFAIIFSKVKKREMRAQNKPAIGPETTLSYPGGFMQRWVSNH